MQIHTKIKILEIQTIIATDTTIIIKTADTITVAISKTTDTTKTAVPQISNKTETTQVSDHADIVTKQIINPGIVKPDLIAADWDISLANVEHHDKIKTIGNKIRMFLKTATQIIHSKKIL